MSNVMLPFENGTTTNYYELPNKNRRYHSVQNVPNIVLLQRAWEAMKLTVERRNTFRLPNLRIRASI